MGGFHSFKTTEGVVIDQSWVAPLLGEKADGDDPDLGDRGNDVEGE